MKFFKENKLFWMILAFLISIRLINITMPILEGTAMRQAQTAMIARNFFRYGINLFYPMADFFGSRPGYLVLEFPLLNCLAAIGYMALGGVHEWIGRLISILFFTGASLFLYLLTKQLFSKETALWSVLIFGLSPLSIIFSRAFMPDFEMVFFCLGALYFLFSFYKSNKPSQYWISALFLSLALLVKAHSFYIFIPLLYLIWRRQGIRFLFNYKNWFYLMIVILPAVLWYTHAKNVHLLYTPEWISNFDIKNWFNPTQLLSKKIYIEIMKIYGNIFLTPFGLTLFVMGMFIRTRKDEELLWAWFLGVVVFLVCFITHIWDPYYNLNMLPVACVFAARAIVFIRTLNWEKSLLNFTYGKVLLIILILPFWLRYTAYAYTVPNGYRYIPDAGEKIRQLSSKEDLIIASSAAGVQALYYCDRNGWPFLIPGNNPAAIKEAKERLEYLRKEGAKYFVATVASEFNKDTEFIRYIFEHYELVEHKDGRYIIFDLKE